MKDYQYKQELIDRYLLGKMDEEESAAFERQLTDQPDLREETDLTRQIITAIRNEREQATLEVMKSVPEEKIRQWLPSPQPVSDSGRRPTSGADSGRRHSSKGQTADSGRRRTLYIFLSAAASAAILFMLYFGFQHRYTTSQLFSQYYQTRSYETYPTRGGFDLTPEERMWMRQAETCYRQADYANALSCYNQLFAQKPDRKTLPEETLFYAAICLLETNDLSGAIELLEYIASEDASDYRDDATLNLAFAYLKNSQRSKAAFCLERLIEAKSDYAAKAKELRDKLKEKKWF